MKKTKLTLVSAFTSLLLAASAQAQITWTGNQDNNFFEPFNWSGNSGPNIGVLFEDDDLIIENVSGEIKGWGKLVLGSGRSLTIINSNVNFRPDPAATPTALVYGIEGETTVDADTEIILINSTLTVQSLSNDVVVKADSSSTLNLGGAGNSINGAGTDANSTKVILGDGAEIIFLSGSNGGGSGTVGQRIVREVSGTTFDQDFTTPPLEEFVLTPDNITPFTSLVGAFSIATSAPPQPLPFPDTMVGIALIDSLNTPADPDDDRPFWLRTRRTATDWQYDVHFADSPYFPAPAVIDGGFFVRSLGYHLADLNGDGLDDKVADFVANGGGGDVHQQVCAYTFAPGIFTNTDSDPPAGDFKFVWFDVVNQKVIFGDIDGDNIDDNCVTVSVTEGNLAQVGYIPGPVAGGLYWAGIKSQGVPGISNFAPGFTNFTGWNPFGVAGLDQPLLGDFNGDGIADRMIYRASTNTAFINFSPPTGGWGAGSVDATIPLGSVVPGAKLKVSDINGDGYDDLVVILEPGFYNAGFQELYGYLNDQNNFVSLTGAPLAVNGLPVPDYADIFGLNTTMLFGKLGPVDDFSGMKITSFSGGGPDQNMSITYDAPLAGAYTTEVSLDLVSWFGVGDVVNVIAPPFSPFAPVTDSMLDFTFPGTDPRPKVFVRVKFSPNFQFPPP